jgi:hypothetical protein
MHIKSDHVAQHHDDSEDSEARRQQEGVWADAPAARPAPVASPPAPCACDVCDDANPLPPPDGRIRIAAVGDSITRGHPLKGKDLLNNYPCRLQRALGEDKYQLFNFGAGGHTMLKAQPPLLNESTSYWNSTQFMKARSCAPHMVLVMLGTNDAVKTTWAALNASFKPDYLDMLAIFKALPSKPVLRAMTTCPLWNGNFAGISQPVVNDVLPGLVRAVSKRASLPPPIAVFEGMGGALADLPWKQCEAGPACLGKHDLFWGNGSYGCHPNVNGYAALSGIVVNALNSSGLLGGTIGGSLKSDDDIIGASRLLVGPLRPLNRALFGVNCGVESDFTSEPILYSNTSLIAAIRALGIGAMRYPGGTPANFFDWHRGSASSYLGQSDVAQRLENAGLAVNCSAFKDCSESCSCYGPVARDISRLPLGTFSPGNFASLLAKADVPTVVWQPDVYFSSNPAAAIATLQAEGVDASTLEISNEIYSQGYSQLLPTVQAFVDRASPAIAAAEQAFPAVRVAWPAFHVTAFLPEDYWHLYGFYAANRSLETHSRQTQWNANLTRSLAGKPGGRKNDALVPHNYLLNSKVLYAFEPEYWAGVTMAFGAATTAYAAKTAGGRELWITEYNLSPPTQIPTHEPHMVPAATWLKNASFSLVHAGHILGHILGGIESNGGVKMLHLHSLFGNPKAGRAFVKLHKGSMMVSSVAQVFAHVAVLAKSYTSMAAVDTSAAGLLAFNCTGPALTRVQAVAFSNATDDPDQKDGSRQDRMALVLINRDVEEVKVHLPACDGRYRHVAYHEKTVAAAALDLAWHEIALDDEPPPFPWPGPVRSMVTPVEQEENRVLVLPPLSVSVVEPAPYSSAKQRVPIRTDGSEKQVAK